VQRPLTWCFASLLSAVPMACSDARPVDEAPLNFVEDVRPILEAACDECHAVDPPPAGWRSTSYLDAIACVGPEGEPADEPSVLPPDASAPILRALARDDHAGLLDEEQRAVLDLWVSSGARTGQADMHAPGIADPRSPDWHADRLRESGWALVLDPDQPDSCGRCHEGAPSRPEGVTGNPPGAPTCTSCHDQPGGVFACTTCHGPGRGTAFDACFRPERVGAEGAHAAHLDPSDWRAGVLSCETCHPAHTVDDVGVGQHGDGTIQIVFDETVAGSGAAFDPETKQCTVACHNRGGAAATPRWTDPGPVVCGDCHSIPPAGHDPRACTTCHAEPDETGSVLTALVFHLNGTVDLGDGGGGCGACHGEGDDPWPRTAAHSAHRNPDITTPIECNSCHVVPSSVGDPGHLDPVVGVELTFGGRALDRGATPSWDGTRCSDVACHGAGLRGGGAVAPVWLAGPGSVVCGSCHPVPPPAPHTFLTTCQSTICHGDEVVPGPDGPSISVVGRARHIDGDIDLGPSP